MSESTTKKRGVLLLLVLLLAIGTAGLGISFWISSSHQSRQNGPPDALTLARLAIAEENFGQAESLLREALVQVPGDRSARRLLGAVLLARGHLSKAHEIYQDLLKDSPDDPAVLVGLARCLGRSGQHRFAVEYLRRASELRKGDLQSLRELAQAEEQAGDYASALLTSRRALSLDPAQEDLSNNMNDLAGRHAGRTDSSLDPARSAGFPNMPGGVPDPRSRLRGGDPRLGADPFGRIPSPIR